MIRSLWVFLCFLGGSQVAVAQQLIEGRVIDQETLEPIPYVNIGFLGKDTGTVGDEEGRFTLQVKSLESHMGDTLRFSSIGYGHYDLVMEGSTGATLAVQMEKTPIVLPSVVVDSYQFKKSRKIFNLLKTLTVWKKDPKSSTSRCLSWKSWKAASK